MTNGLSYVDQYHLGMSIASPSELIRTDAFGIKSSYEMQNSWMTSPERETLMESLSLGQEKVKRKRRSPKVAWRKPEGMPKRPLSAYNLFFRSERERLLNIPRQKPAVKQGRRAKSGIGFAGLAQQIASKWKSLDVKARRVFQDQASEEKQRYKKEVELWKKEQDLKKPKDIEEKNQKKRKPEKKIHTIPSPYLPLSSDIMDRSPRSTCEKSDWDNWMDSVSLDQGVDDQDLSEADSIHGIKPTFPQKRYHSDSLIEIQSAVYKPMSYEECENDFENIFEHQFDVQEQSNNSSTDSSLLTLAESLDDESFQFIAALNRSE